MPISFDLASYKNTFPGEIVESDVIAGNNGNEFLRIVIADLDHSGHQIVSEQKCGYGDCTLMVRHRHQPPLWESEKQGSNLHRFVESVNIAGQTNTKTNFTFKDFIGKKWLFIGEKSRDWKDPATQEMRQGRTYYYVSGPVDKPVDNETDSLPDPITGEPMTNGAITARDLDNLLAAYADGKNLQQIIQGVMLKEEVPEFTKHDTYVATIVDQTALKRCIDEHKWLTVDSANVYHTTENWQSS